MSFSVCVLLCKAHLDMARFCLPTLAAACKDAYEGRVYDDGSLGEEDREEVAELLPGWTVVSARESDELVEPLLRSVPACREFRQHHRFARKLLDIPLLHPTGYGYVDSDVVFLRDFTGFDRAGHTGGGVTYMWDIDDYSSIQFLHRYFTGTRIRLAERVNAGFMFVGKGTYDLEFVEWFLGQPRYRDQDWAVEQTCWAAMAARVDAAYFSPSQVTFPRSDRRVGPEVAALHYISPLRGLFPPPTEWLSQRQERGTVRLDVVPASSIPLRRAVALRVRRRLSNPRARTGGLR
jgi:hypothetical protein